MELLEGIAMNLPAVDDDKCPICEKKPHPTTEDAKQGKAEYRSKPKNLGCSPIPPAPHIANYTTAAHHLICANQCFIPFHRLSQMAMTVGYDINAPRNGLSLPTVGQKKKNKYFPEGVKFGDLTVPRQRDVSFEIMEFLEATPGFYGAQWHVGHHDWSWDMVAELVTDTDPLPHGPNYEGEVNKRLRQIEDQIVADKDEVCEPDDNGERGKRVATDLDSLSDDIKNGIKRWKKFFVSAAAAAYARSR